MAQSKHRDKHGHPRHHHPKQASAPRVAKAAPPRRSAISIMVVFLAVLGCGIAFIAVGANIAWLVAGAAAGGLMGYFIGQSMDKVAAKEK